MLFNSAAYLIFLPIAVVGYYIFPPRLKCAWLLGVSYYFYMQWNPMHALLMLSCTALTYFAGRVLDGLSSGSVRSIIIRRLCFWACVLLNLCVLGYFKYFHFGVDNMNRILLLMGVKPIQFKHDILLPVGISFYTLQALGYLIDVYRRDIPAEKNIIKYALFVSFFPQLVAGPIERSQNLIRQLGEAHRLDYENIRRGLLLVLYGLFLKMVIADRAAILVDTVYENTVAYPGFYVVVATLFFAVQIYCDFYGYSVIARGSALMMGIRLMSNFESPYFSKSVKEFWRRWHISLSTWFRDYLYIPLGGNQNGKMRETVNLLIVFAVSGLWHGASVAFLCWGLLNGGYQVLAKILCETRRRLRKETLPWEGAKPRTPHTFSRRLLQNLVTFVLIDFSWIFFRAGGGKASLVVLRDLFSVNNCDILWNGALFTLGIGRSGILILAVAVGCLFCVDRFRYKGRDAVAFVLEQDFWFRYLVYAGLFFSILLFGCYGEAYNAQQFIYFQF